MNSIYKSLILGFLFMDVIKKNGTPDTLQSAPWHHGMQGIIAVLFGFQDGVANSPSRPHHALKNQKNKYRCINVQIVKI